MKMDEPLAICYKWGNLMPILLLSKLLAASLKMGAANLNQTAPFPITHSLASTCP